MSRATPLTREELAEIRLWASEEYIKEYGPADWTTETVRRLLATYDECVSYLRERT